MIAVTRSPVVLVLDKGCATNPVRAALPSGDITDAGVPIPYVAALKDQGEIIQTLAAVDRAAFEGITCVSSAISAIPGWSGSVGIVLPEMG